MRFCIYLLPAALYLLIAAVSSGQEPGWSGRVVASGDQREQIEATPIELRPYRPLHFYGNTVRRQYYRGTAVPTPRDFVAGASALVRRGS